MKKVLGATAGLLIVLASVAPAGQSVSAAGIKSPAIISTPSVASWDWPK